MTIELYKSTAEPERVDKSGYLTNKITLTGDARESVDKMSVSIRIQYVGELLGYNYAYISDLGRWYFIRTDKIERNNIHRIEMETDVLYSNKTDILASYGIISRNENEYQTKLFDERLRFLGYKLVNSRNFNKVSNGECFILAVNGS